MKGKKKNIIINDSDDECEVENFYSKKEVQAFCPKYNNPKYDPKTMPFKHPMRGVIVGASGSGKSNVLLDLIKKTMGTFNSIKLFVQDKDEPLYQYLASKIEPPQLEIFEGIDAFNNYDVKEDLKHGQHLLIFDDFVIEPAKKQKKIEELFIRGRKMSDKGLSMLYLTQSYYQTPIIIRKQCNYVILKKVNGKRDIGAILKDSSIDADGKQLQNMYNHCVKSADDISNFMLLDKSAPEEQRFRKNYNTLLNPEDF